MGAYHSDRPALDSPAMTTLRELVLEAMRAEAASQRDVASGIGITQGRVSHVLRYAFSVAFAERVLAFLGYRVEMRLVKVPREGGVKPRSSRG